MDRLQLRHHSGDCQTFAASSLLLFLEVHWVLTGRTNGCLCASGFLRSLLRTDMAISCLLKEEASDL